MANVDLSWSSFLIDLDLAVKEDREKSSGAPNKTGTRAFMSIGALYGEKRSFRHDLESFFGGFFFWICIHRYITLGREGRAEWFRDSRNGTTLIQRNWPK